MATAKKKKATKPKYDPNATVDIPTIEVEYSIPYVRKVRLAIPVPSLADLQDPEDYDIHDLVAQSLDDIERLAYKDLSSYEAVIAQNTVGEIKRLQVDPELFQDLDQEVDLVSDWHQTITHHRLTVKQLMERFGYTEAYAAKLLPKPVKLPKARAVAEANAVSYDFYSTDPGIDLARDARVAKAKKARGRAVHGPDGHTDDNMSDEDEE